MPSNTNRDNQDSLKELGAFIREERKKQRMTLSTLADRVGKSSSYLSFLERGQNPNDPKSKPIRPSKDLLLQLGSALGLTYEYGYRKLYELAGYDEEPLLLESLTGLRSQMRNLDQALYQMEVQLQNIDPTLRLPSRLYDSAGRAIDVFLGDHILLLSSMSTPPNQNASVVLNEPERRLIADFICSSLEQGSPLSGREGCAINLPEGISSNHLDLLFANEPTPAELAITEFENELGDFARGFSPSIAKASYETLAAQFREKGHRFARFVAVSSSDLIKRIPNPDELLSYERDQWKWDLREALHGRPPVIFCFYRLEDLTNLAGISTVEALLLLLEAHDKLLFLSSDGELFQKKEAGRATITELFNRLSSSKKEISPDDFWHRIHNAGMSFGVWASDQDYGKGGI